MGSGVLIPANVRIGGCHFVHLLYFLFVSQYNQHLMIDNNKTLNSWTGIINLQAIFGSA